MPISSDGSRLSRMSSLSDASPSTTHDAAHVCLVWVPRADARRVRQALIQHDFAFTCHTVRSGHWDRPWVQFWLITAAESVPLLTALLRRLSPPRTVRYHSPHGWHTDAWLHPTTVTLQGALCTTWAVDTTTGVGMTPVFPDDLSNLSHSERSVSP